MTSFVGSSPTRLAWSPHRDSRNSTTTSCANTPTPHGPDRRAQEELPSGTVAFLFTEVEGSTRLWEDHPDVMRHAMLRHDELLREAVESHDGFIVKNTGDGFQAVFATAHDAVTAAVAAQRGLLADDWNSPRPCASGWGFIPARPRSATGTTSAAR